MNHPEEDRPSAPDARSALVFGAASCLGATVMKQLGKREGVSVIAVDIEERRDFLVDLISELGFSQGQFEVLVFDPGKPALGFKRTAIQRIKKSTAWIFHLAHIRDRTLNVSEVGNKNRVMCEQMLSLAREVHNLESIVVVTDVGLCGDFPGKFSESWVDVGQIPFDEVDRSSLEVETVCNRETKLPIIRARVGLLSDLEGVSALSTYWRPAAEVLLSSIRLIKLLPRFLSIPTAVANDSLAPLTPVEWGGRAIVYLSSNPEAVGKAVHLVITPPPSMESVLSSLAKQAGGARVKGGLPVGIVNAFGMIPGLMETARRHADHIASWWTPHRYCLSKNNLDTTGLETLLPEALFPPSWNEMEAFFFRQMMATPVGNK